MTQVQGFDPNHSGQKPIDDAGNLVAVGVWGDSDIGIGVFGTQHCSTCGPTPAFRRSPRTPRRTLVSRVVTLFTVGDAGQ
jgi:hypothetical protein